VGWVPSQVRSLAVYGGDVYTLVCYCLIIHVNVYTSSKGRDNKSRRSSNYFYDPTASNWTYSRRSGGAAKQGVLRLGQSPEGDKKVSF